MQSLMLIFVAFSLIVSFFEMAQRMCLKSQLHALRESFRLSTKLIGHLQAELHGLRREFDIRRQTLPPENRAKLWQPIDEITARATEALLDNDNFDAVKQLELAIREARTIVLK